MVAITNDIYTVEDAQFLARNKALPEDRIMGVETGGCPHTAIRDDTTMNAVAVEKLQQRHPDTKLVLIESGGDNLSKVLIIDVNRAHFYSPALCRVFIKLPAEDPKVSDPLIRGELLQSMYGTQDAATNWGELGGIVH